MAAGVAGTELGVPLAATQVLAGGLALGLGAGRSRIGAAGLTVAAAQRPDWSAAPASSTAAGVLQHALGEPADSPPEHGKLGRPGISATTTTGRSTASTSGAARQRPPTRR